MAFDDSRQKNFPKQDFATTRWSIVIAAGQRSSANSHQALEVLCETYWYPLYAYARRQVSDVGEAQDLTQAFFAEILEKNGIRTADAKLGKFRAYLLTAFKNFLSKQWAKGKALKRGGGRAVIPLHFEVADSNIRLEPAAGLTPEQYYDQQWAITLLSQIMTRLENELSAAGKAAQFRELKGFIVGDHPGNTYAQAAQRLNVSEMAAKKAASRMRQRYRDLLTQEIAQTVASPDEVEDELHELFEILMR